MPGGRDARVAIMIGIDENSSSITTQQSDNKKDKKSRGHSRLGLATMLRRLLMSSTWLNVVADIATVPRGLNDADDRDEQNGDDSRAKQDAVW